MTKGGVEYYAAVMRSLYAQADNRERGRLLDAYGDTTGRQLLPRSATLSLRHWAPAGFDSAS